MTTERPSKSTPPVYDIKERPYAAFFDACRRGDIETVKQCWAEGIVLSAEEPHNYSCDREFGSGLEFACLNGHLPLVKYFYEELNVEINNDFYSFDSSISSAFKSGNVALVKYLYAKDNPNTSDVERSFQIACARGNVEIVRYLTEEQGIDPQKGDTIYEKYITRKVNDEEYCRKILALALRSGNLDLVRYFCEEKGFELFWLSSEEIFREACRSGNLELIKYLHETKGIVFPIANEEDKIFKRLCKTGNLSLIEYYCANTVGTPPKNKKIFHAACKSGNVDVVRYLHETLGFEIDITSQVHNPFLSFYPVFVNLAILRYIFSKLGDTEELRQFEAKVFKTAIWASNLSVVRYFCEERHHSIDNDLLCACGRTSLDVVKYLREKHPDIRAAMEQKGTNVLLEAIDCCNVDMINYLCTVHSIKLPTEYSQDGWEFNNPLHYIGEKLFHEPSNEFETVKYLCEVQRIDVNATAAHQFENTVLHSFSRGTYTHPDTLRYLWRKVKDPRKVNNQGQTIVHACSNLGNPHHLPLLLSLGANLTAGDSSGNTVVEHLTDRAPDLTYFIMVLAYLYKYGVHSRQFKFALCIIDALCDALTEFEDEGKEEQFELLLKYPAFCNCAFFKPLAHKYVDKRISLATSFTSFMTGFFALREGFFALRGSVQSRALAIANEFLNASFKADPTLFLKLLEKCLLNEDKRYQLNGEHTQFLLREILKGTLCDHNEDILKAVFHIYYDKAVGFRNDEKVHQKMLHISFLFIALLRKRSLKNIQDDSDSETLAATPHDEIFIIVFSQILKIDGVFFLKQLVTEYPATVSTKIFDLCNYIAGVNRSFVLTIFEDIERLCRINSVKMEIELRRLKTLRMQAKIDAPNEERNNPHPVKRERDEDEGMAEKINRFGLMTSGDADGNNESKKIKIVEANPAQEKTEHPNETVPRFG